MADLEPRARLARVVEGVVISLTTMAVAGLAILLWQAYSHGNFVRWIGGMSRSDVVRAIENALDENENELKVLTGRVLITINNDDSFAKPYEDGMFDNDDVFGVAYVFPDLTNSEKNNRGVMEGQIKFSKPFASIPKVVIALSTIDTGRNTHTRIRTTVDQVDTEGFNYRFHVWRGSVLERAEASWIAVGK